MSALDDLFDGHYFTDNPHVYIPIDEAQQELAELRADNARLKAQVDEISGLITQFKKARGTTAAVDAIAKIVVWNVEQEDRIGKEKRELLKSTD